MARNDFRKLRDWDLQEKAALAAQVLGADPATYGIDPADAAELAALAAQFRADIQAVTAARAAYRAEVQGKDATRAQTADLMARLGQNLYANSALSEAQIVDAGYAAHDAVRSPVGAFEPMGLTASPNANGTVELKWDRAGNAFGVTFVIEVKRGEGEWRVETFTSRSSLTLEGFPPGDPAWFRVYAKSATRRSEASGVVGIYAGHRVSKLAA